MASRKGRRAKSGWTEAHVKRLFWRAGFGATDAEARRWAKRGKAATIAFLTRPGNGVLRGRAASVKGRLLDPINGPYGDDVLWWIDRMARTDHPLVEKMTLFWHDHFATEEQFGALMIAQNEMFRRNALGKFSTMLYGVTQDPAMQKFLSLLGSNRRKPNENYARELLELFTLGHNNGYTEQDIREAARALTGWRARREDNEITTTYFDPLAHDQKNKTIFGKTGNFGWQDVCDLTIENAAHAPYLIDKLWLFFVGGPASAGRRAQLVKVYRDSQTDLRPVLREILGSPELYASLDRPAMIKWPAVYVAGLLRQTQSRVTDQYWTWTLSEMGQTLFNPPSVAGWDTGLAWMSSNTMKARFEAVSSLMADQRLHVGVRAVGVKPGLTAKQHLANAQRATSSPWTSAKTETELLALAQKILRTVKPGYQRQYAKERGAQVQSALRHILLSGPDAQLH